MKTSLPLTIAVTGHRDIEASDVASVDATFRNWLLELVSAYPFTPLRLLTGLAEGADRMAARVFCDLRASLIREGNRPASEWEMVAVLPMAEEGYRDDFPESVGEFDDLLSQATAVITLSGPSTEDLRAHPELRVDRYEALGRRLVRHSNILAAFWDGQYIDRRGGASHMVRLKLEGDAEAVSSFSIARHDCGPVWRLPVNRKSNKNIAGIAEASPQEPVWLYPEGAHLSKVSFEASWRAMDQFNARQQTCLDPASVEQSVQWLSPSHQASEDLRQKLGLLDRRTVGVYAAADIMAMKIEGRRLWLMRALYGLGGLLALCLWTALDNVLQLWMAAGYVVLVIAIFVGVRKIRRRELSDDPLSYRFLAEALRVQTYWSIAHVREHPARREAPQGHSENWEALRALDSLLSQQAQEIGWAREALRIGALDPDCVRNLNDDLRSAHLEHWIKDQLSYFKRAERRHEKRIQNIGRASVACAVLAIVSAAGVVAIDVSKLFPEEIRHFFAIPAAVFPPFALLLESYSDRLALEEQQKSAIRMQSVFGRAAQAWNGRRTGARERDHLIRSLGQEALAECAYWLVLRKSKPTKIPT